MSKSKGLPTKTIRTSEKGWLAELAKAYKEKNPTIIFDDAEIGFDPKSQTILEMGIKAKLTLADWVAVLISLGVSAIGAWLIAIAFIDPEPTSKLSILLVGGVLMIGSGGFTAVRIITKIKPEGGIEYKDGAWILRF